MPVFALLAVSFTVFKNYCAQLRQAVAFGRLHDVLARS
jgi:hypothetical protein